MHKHTFFIKWIYCKVLHFHELFEYAYSWYLDNGRFCCTVHTCIMLFHIGTQFPFFWTLKLIFLSTNVFHNQKTHEYWSCGILDQLFGLWCRYTAGICMLAGLKLEELVNWYALLQCGFGLLPTFWIQNWKYIEFYRLFLSVWVFSILMVWQVKEHWSHLIGISLSSVGHAVL